MSGQYNLTPYLWLTLPSVVFFILLGGYAWRRRAMPAALPFAYFCLFAALWTLGHSFELMAQTQSAWLFWRQFQLACQLPTSTAVFCFVVQFAGHGRRLTRPVVALLTLPSLLVGLSLLTSGYHGFVWRLDSGPLGADITPGPGGWLLNSFSLALGVLNYLILGRLILRSPLDRWPAALILANLLLMRAAQTADIIGSNPFYPLSTVVLSFIPAAAIFALVLFGFRLFDPIRLARRAVIDQMADGVIVLDLTGHVADLNRAAETFLGVPAERARGQALAAVLPAAVLPAGVALDGLAEGAGEMTLAFDVGGGEKRQGGRPVGEEDRAEALNYEPARHYTMQVSPLRDRRGLLHGRLLLLRDVTGQRRAEAELLAQQRALATLQERERLARELHDSAGQVLAYVSLQAQAIRKRVLDGDTAAAEAQLAQLAAAAQGAHLDVRESILSLKAVSIEGHPFAETLDRYLTTYADHYGLSIRLAVAGGLDDPFAPEAGVQVLRVVQEALSNARKHGHAHHVDVSLGRAGTEGRTNGSARVIIADDGLGFDLAAIDCPAGNGNADHLGLAIMRERMAQIGGRLAIESQPGAGTRVVLDAPIMHRDNQT